MVDLVVEERTQALWVEQELLVKEMLELEQQIDVGVEQAAEQVAPQLLALVVNLEVVLETVVD
jgi:hypothetical protein